MNLVNLVFGSERNIISVQKELYSYVTVRTYKQVETKSLEMLLVPFFFVQILFQILTRICKTICRCSTSVRKFLRTDTN